MAEGEQRIEVLEDEMKVLKGEVSRTLVDLRALLMREDSPLSNGGLRARQAKDDASSESMVPISLPTPEAGDALGAGPAAVTNAGAGEEPEVAGVPSALDGLIGNTASLANDALTSPGTPPGAPPGAPPGPALGGAGPVMQDIPGSEMVLRHEIGGSHEDAEIEARLARIRELEQEEEMAREERARRREEEDREEQAARERRTSLRQQSQEVEGEDELRDAGQRVSEGDIADEERERRERRRKQDQEDFQRHDRRREFGDVAEKERAAGNQHRERRAKQRERHNDEFSAILDLRANRLKRAAAENKTGAAGNESRRGRAERRQNDDDEPEDRTAKRGFSDSGDDYPNSARALRYRNDFDDDLGDDLDEEDGPRTPRRYGRRGERSGEGVDRDYRARMAEDRQEGEFTSDYLDRDYVEPNDLELDYLELDDLEDEDGPYWEDQYPEYEYELDDDRGYYDEDIPDEEYMERGREQERETRRGSGREDDRGGRANPGRRPSERAPHGPARSARGRRGEDDYRRHTDDRQAGGYRNGDPRGYSPGDRGSGYPRYSDEHDYNRQESRRRPRQPVEDQRVYGDPEYYGELGSRIRREPRDPGYSADPRDLPNGHNGAEYGARPPQPQPQYGEYAQPDSGYGGPVYDSPGYGPRQYSQEPIPAKGNHPAMDLNLVASLLRWASIAKHRVGDKRLGEIVELYVESRSAPPGLKEALDHITSVADEQAPDSGQNTQETLDLISHLHGILTATLPVPMVPNIKGNLKIAGEYHTDPRGDW